MSFEKVRFTFTYLIDCSLALDGLAYFNFLATNQLFLKSVDLLFDTVFMLLLFVSSMFKLTFGYDYGAEKIIINDFNFTDLEMKLIEKEC